MSGRSFKALLTVAVDTPSSLAISFKDAISSPAFFLKRFRIYLIAFSIFVQVLIYTQNPLSIFVNFSVFFFVCLHIFPKSTILENKIP